MLTLVENYIECNDILKFKKMTNNNEHEYLTREKYDELVKELDHLKKITRKEVAESLEYAKSLGDLSENAEYQEAREWQANIEDRIAKLEAILLSRLKSSLLTMAQMFASARRLLFKRKETR